MANTMYQKAAQHFLDGTLAWSGNIKCVLVDSADYTPNFATHEFLSDIPGAGRVATSGNLTGVVATLDGIADADDITIAAVTGDSSEYLVIYKDTGVAGTSPLIVLFDTLSGLPVTPNGTDVTITWDNGTNKIFKL